MGEMITSVTLGGTTLPVAPIPLGRVDTAWPAYEAALSIGGARPLAESIAAARGLIYVACSSHDPTFKADKIDKLRGVRPKELFAVIQDLAPVLGTDDSPGELVHEIPKEIVLGRQRLRVAPIELGQAQEIWPAFDIAIKKRGEAPFAEQIRALRSVAFACCAAADPTLTEESFMAITGVNASEFFRLNAPLAYLLGYLDVDGKKDAPEGEAEAGAAPAA